MPRKPSLALSMSLALPLAAVMVMFAIRGSLACTGSCSPLGEIFRSHDLIILGDVKHGVKARIAFFSSEDLFSSMAAAGVRHVAIEMPRVLGRQALGVEEDRDVAAFANDVVNSGRWHFTDPEHPDEENETTQRHVASAMARQVLLAKRYGINPIFYDFNNPLGNFASSPRDPVYRCLTTLTSTTWVRYGLDQRISKDDRDAAIMRERFSHDDELANYIHREAAARGGGKIVVVPGFAHAVLPNGLAERLEQTFAVKPTVVAVFTTADEEASFPAFLSEQATLLKVDLSRPADYEFRIDQNKVAVARRFEAALLDGSKQRVVPSVCYQVANGN